MPPAPVVAFVAWASAHAGLVWTEVHTATRLDPACPASPAPSTTAPLFPTPVAGSPSSAGQVPIVSTPPLVPPPMNPAPLSPPLQGKPVETTPAPAASGPELLLSVPGLRHEPLIKLPVAPLEVRTGR